MHALALANTVGGDLAKLASAIAIGLALGAIPVRSVRLGISGVLFSALLFGQLGLTIDARVLGFTRDLSLIIFMYALGLQVGPGLGASLRSAGRVLIPLTLAVIVLGAIITAAVVPVIPKGMGPGLYAGAFSTTPGLAAAQETLSAKPAAAGGADLAARTGLAYAITYPVGIVGPIFVILTLRVLFRVRLDEEKSALAEAERIRRGEFAMMDIEVTSPTHVGHPLHSHALLRDRPVVLSRVVRDGVMTVPTAETVVRMGDIYRLVGPKDTLEELAPALGRRHDLDLSKIEGDVQPSSILVTRTQILHRTLRELDLPRRTGVTIARLHRAGVELVPTAALRLAFADQVVAVGPQAGLRLVEAELGNRVEQLNRSQLIPIFVGMVLGVLIGSIPLPIPGMHAPLRIGLAGGSLLAAIVLSRIGSVGSVVWYMPAAANQLVQDFGLAMFLACVGFRSGDHFLQHAAQNSGVGLVLWGMLITIAPVFLVACFARRVLRMNFVTLAGWVAGAMGSTTALMFGREMTSSDELAIPYAAVMPVAELMPIVCAQVLAVAAGHG